ncbi:SUKH-4 family immunity protein [Streptomyces zingiberis]|uniref:Nucleic acid/nucleotide deaminase of polymorphic system toxin n=1 Tax=Streptomyces zingiberis TaxID=2053010 RepID=A0ABX1BYR5_9ACTN|nr:SUKH-4 family immunity protein [Streptomyces zingiberis]NJQ02781.1 hypothetical protein [Streptomyces zingiberis]
MVTFAQAQERAEEWINGDLPGYQHRAVHVREFDLGFVVWAEDREDGPRSDGGGARMVIARDSGDTTLWPALPVGTVIRHYEERYGATPQDAPPAEQRPRRVDLEATSFLLTPPQWLQDAADQLGIPDRRRDPAPDSPAASGPGASPAPQAQPAPQAPQAPPAPSSQGGAPAAGTAWPPAEGSAAGTTPPEPGPAEGAAVHGAPAPTAHTAPATGTPWAGTDTTAGPDDASVELPETVFAPPLTGPGAESPAAPAGPRTGNGDEARPGGATPPPVPPPAGPPPVTPAGEGPAAAPGSSGGFGPQSGPATPPGGRAPGAPPPPPPGAAGGDHHHAATMLAGPNPGGPSVPPPPGPPGTPGGATPPPPGPPPPAPGTPPGARPATPPGAGGAYGYPQAPAGAPMVGPGYMAVLRYRAQDGSEQQIIRRSAYGTPHPEWQILHELRSRNVPPQQVLELHTELESCDLPGGYCARMIRETFPQVRISHTAPYGRDHATRQQGVRHLIEHQGELHQVADGPARPAPNRVPLPHPGQVPPVPPVPPEGLAHELAQAFGPQGLFRFDQHAVSRQGVPPVVGHTLVVAGLPVDFGPFFWAQAQPGRPVPTLAELAAERGVAPASDAGSYLVVGSDFGRQLCVQYGTANIVAVPLEGGPGGQPVPPQFVSTGLPEFVRCLAMLGRMWRLRYGLTPEQAGRWTVDFQAQLVALDPAALATPETWWSVLLEQMWDGLL